MIAEPAFCCYEELSVSQGSCKSVLMCLWLSSENILTEAFFFPFYQDQKLTKEEVLDNWNMFVGSQATNYGEDLTRNHDELWSSVPASVPHIFSPPYWNHCVHPLLEGRWARDTHNWMTCINIIFNMPAYYLRNHVGIAFLLLSHG